MTIEDAVLQKLKDLPPEKQRAVLAYLESLIASEHDTEPRTMSVLEVAAVLVGSLDGGPGDLAIDPEHLEGYGR